MRETKRLRVQSLGQKIPWRRARQTTPVFLPRESHGQRNLMGYIVHRVTKSQTRIKQLSTHALIIMKNPVTFNDWEIQGSITGRVELVRTMLMSYDIY